jgi:hypothetical protein
MEFIIVLFEEGIESNMVLEGFFEFVKKYNMLFGVLICALVTSVVFMIIPVYFFFLADIHLIIGNCFGLYFTFKNRIETQSHIKTGLIVGLVGSLLSLLLIAIFVWIFYLFDFMLFLQYLYYLFVSFGILFILVGIVLGYLFGNRYKKRENADILAPRF